MAEYSLADDVLFIGHSLVGVEMPAMVEDLVAGQGGDGSVSFQVINGAPLVWNWQHSASAQGVDARAVLPQGDTEVIVMTEGVSLANHITWSGSAEYARNFYDLAVASNPGARVFLYETWHSLDSGTGVDVPYDDGDAVPWRDRIDRDLAAWQGIADAVNAGRPAGAAEMELIPVGQAMARLHDEIAAGRVPGVSSVADLFADDIHPNSLGNYFVALVQYATIYGRTPIGLPHRLDDDYGTAFDAPSPELAGRLQEIAWDTARAFEGSVEPPRGSVIDGDGGGNVLSGDDGNDTVRGHDGNDTLAGGSGNDSLFGGTGDDALLLDGSNDLLDGGSGLDWVRVGGAAGATIDLAAAGAQATGYGWDTILGVEHAAGGSGADRLGGSASANILEGSGGNDTLMGQGGNDVLRGGDGNDLLDGGAGNDRLGGKTGNDALHGSAGDDRLYGDDGSDVLRGGDGNDLVAGGAGSDTLHGGAGNDVLDGGADGVRDVFVFRAVADSAVGGRDVVRNFVSGVDDLDLSGIDARATLAGDQAFEFGGTAARAHSAWYVADQAGVTVRGDVNGDRVADFEIRLDGCASLAAQDFLL